jgi:Spy/CpxP family protein refolding chaperone
MNVKKAIAGMFLTVCISGSVFAQDGSMAYGGRPKGHHHRFDMMAKLNLTDAQKGELKTINEDYKKQLTDLKKNEDITVKEWKSKMSGLRKDHHSKVQHVLTADQKASMKKLMAERKAEMKKHRGQRLEKMKKDLNLTDAQVASLKKNHESAMQQFKAIREDKSLTDEQKKEKLKAFKQQQHESLKSVLTPEQLQKMQEV